ncbi:alpha/beta hydrolase [Actinoplanes sp. TBRC 11911]|nr:alpha/beta hydrolase [Actinoplanes sp. TBRC 11911]
MHGMTVSAAMWRRRKQAETIAASGYRVILPDFRGHGRSAKPRDPAVYRPDVLAYDSLALIEQLGLADYDLGGYSLGARVAVRMMVHGATPRRAVLAGHGMRGITGDGGSTTALLRRIFAAAGTFEPDSAEERMERWLRSTGVDLVALENVLDSIVATTRDEVAGIDVPALVLVGAEDERAATAGELATALPHGTLSMVPGNHVTAPMAPELVAAIIEFLGRA